MRPHLLLRGTGLALTLLVAAAFFDAPPAARADLVILKDGYTLHGKVKRETSVYFDSLTGQPFEVPKQFFMVDDFARRVLFGARQVEDVDDTDLNRDVDLVQLRRQVINLDNWSVPTPFDILNVTPFDAKWERTVRIRGPQSTADVRQRITQMTPQYVRVDSLRYRWPILYLTRELDPQEVRDLLVQHPDLQPKSDAKDVDRRFRVARFLQQASWYDLAEKELAGILKDLPDQKERVESARVALYKLRLLQHFDDVQRAHEAGRSRWVEQALTGFPLQAADDKLANKVRALKTQYATARERLGLARRFLQELPPKIDETPMRQAFAEAAAAILGELTADNSGRLDAFAALAQQADRDRQQDRKPAYTPEQLLALAVTGWLLGNSVAETKVDAALKLWRARQFVLDYQRTHGPHERQQKLKAYEKEGAVAFDELARMLRVLPPPEANGAWSTACGQWLAVTSQQLAAPVHFLPALTHWPLATDHYTLNPDQPLRLKFQCDVPWSQRRGADYWVQLPKEYQPGRTYPLLIALHHAGEDGLDVLKRWSAHAAERGCILAAPSWERSTQRGYNYTTQEHAAVVDVLWEMRRRFPVDSDRVFLAGFGEGGNMAWDVGLAHPDLFAGVLPMGGHPRYFARAYRHNGQYLPFYVVEGDRNGKHPLDIREQFKLWVARGYPALYVEYKGRGLEWFAPEVPHAFDWMARKKRSAAFPEVGRTGGDEFVSMRPTDNRFYWLGVDGLAERNTNDAAHWKATVFGAALTGRVLEGNNINITVRGFKRATVWLGPGMIDFDKGVTLRVNGGVAFTKRLVKPSLATLLEDLYQRGDRQRVYWAKMDVTL